MFLKERIISTFFYHGVLCSTNITIMHVQIVCGMKVAIAAIVIPVMMHCMRLAFSACHQCKHMVVLGECDDLQHVIYTKLHVSQGKNHFDIFLPWRIMLN
mmetsp:Transcript_37992/g.81968  ORF Transcript_37992/g.81968 Transcript_37992/m.81968 type:complete len:100 (+) Transcript_37992:29-328(+)